MSIRNRIALALAACLLLSAQTVTPQVGGGIRRGFDGGITRSAVAGAPTTCAASTTFIARTSGLSGAESSAYGVMICGMIFDGGGCAAWAGSSGNLDALYIFATNTKTTAYLNLCSTSFGLVEIGGAPTFTADQGVNGVGSCLDTGFIASSAPSPKYVLNSATLGTYVFSGASVGGAEMGANDTQRSNVAGVIANNYDYAINNAVATLAMTPNTVMAGSYLVTRTGATTTTAYKNEVSVATDATASLSVPTVSIFIMAINSAGTCAAASNSLIAAAFIGGGMSGPQVLATQRRINGYMTALGRNVY